MKRAAQILFLLDVIAFYCSDLSAQNDLSFEKIDNRIGLSSDIVLKTIQDKEGFLWFITEDGLNRYDGYEIKVYKHGFNATGDFSSSNFRSICEDQDGKLWLGTQNAGINIFDKVTGNTQILLAEQASPDNISDNTINSLFCDSEGLIWIGHNQGIQCWDPKKEKLIQLPESGSSPPPGSIICCFAESTDGLIIIGTWESGLYVYDKKTRHFKNFIVPDDGIPLNFENRIWCILPDENMHYWIGTWEGGLYLTKITGDSLVIERHFTHQPDNPRSLLLNIIYSLQKDDKGSLWIGTPYGLNIMGSPWSANPVLHKCSPGNKSNELSYPEVYDIFRDRSGIMWLSTSGGGINKVDQSYRRFNNFTIPQTDLQIKGTAIHSFYISPEESLFVGVRSLGFGKYDLNSNSFVPYKKISAFRRLPPDLNTAFCFHKDQEGYLWVGTRYEGVYRINLQTGDYVNYLRDASNSPYIAKEVRTIGEDSFGHIWIGTIDGLFKFVPTGKAGNFEIYHYLPEKNNPLSLAGKIINCVYIASDSTLWVGTDDGGLCKLTTNLKSHAEPAFQNFMSEINIPLTLKSKLIYSIYEDRNHRIWIGTGDDGIAFYSLKQQSFTHFPEEIGWQGDAVFGIIEDNQGALWLTTNHGVSKLVYKSNTDIWLENFTYEDGLQGNLFIRGAIMKDLQGNIYVGGHNGFNVFRPDEISTNEAIPPVVITDIFVLNKPVQFDYSKGKELLLTHKEINFAIRFSALSFSQPGKNKYAYKLEGFDKEWQLASNIVRTATYANLKPGQYIFKVKASNNSGIWNNSPLELKIRVKPAPYKSTWAVMIYAIVFVAILFVIYYFIYKSIRIKHAYDIERIEHQKSEKINQFKLRFFTNISHELLTPLSVISWLVEEISSSGNVKPDSLSTMKNNLNRLMRLISQLLDFRKVETGNMKLELKMTDIDTLIKNLFGSVKPLAEKKHIEIKFNGRVGKEICIDPDKLEKIIGNLLSNALKYTPAKENIFLNYSVLTEEGHEFLKVEVLDTGEGIEEKHLPYIFDRFYKVESVTGRTFGAGIGLALAKNMVELHEGEITGGNRKEGGAVFSFKIPLSQSHNDVSKNEIEPRVEKYSDNIPLIVDDSEDEEPIPVPQITFNRQYTLLIIEDHFDFRKMMVNYFSNFFITLEAEDGKKGLELINNKMPEVVISDIMMPGMNGAKICSKVKESLMLSHIIFILLTAKISENGRYQGYLAGADSYLTKPVNLKLLHARVASLIQQRETLHKKFNNGLMKPFSESGLTVLDDQFLTKIKSFIETNIISVDLNIKSMCTELGTSNSMLYRKLTSLTGMSPVEFIRYIRLQHAARLLLKQANVTEAAYGSGFNDLSYFGTCFKKQFGINPKNFSQLNFKM
ncbi:MAG: helix-turn-helix domain-containing protein [Bacteroidales bacterium]|nr:helix-turn-helix domain-containing protein [Bacteroidales bacterium]